MPRALPRDVANHHPAWPCARIPRTATQSAGSASTRTSAGYLNGPAGVCAQGPSGVPRRRNSCGASRSAGACGGAPALACRSLLFLVGTTCANRWTEPPLRRRSSPITSAPGKEFQPSFSPDGKRIVYSASGETGENTDIYVQTLGVGGSRSASRRDAAADLSPAWSPDGSRIAWLRTGPKETAVFVSPAGGAASTARSRTCFRIAIEAVGRHLDWSPDGQWLAAADKNSPAALPHRADRRARRPQAPGHACRRRTSSATWRRRSRPTANRWPSSARCRAA